MGMKALQSCKPPSLRHGSGGVSLIEDLQRELHNPNFCDVIIVCEGKEFSAHKFLLAARSPVLKGFTIQYLLKTCPTRGPFHKKLKIVFVTSKHFGVYHFGV